MERLMNVRQFTKEQVFEFLRPDEIDSLSNRAEVIRLEAGQLVYQKGDRADFLYVVLRGAVALRLPGRDGVTVLIDQLTKPGSMFGACTSPSIETCVLTAQCEQDTELLRIEKSALKQLLDDDPRMGYAIQSKISEIYFKRYIETMRQLQAIIMNIPIRSN
jgi:CRP-like cAMP-binding protein